MIRNPAQLRKNYSESSQWLLANNGNFLDIQPNSVSVLGPAGLWAGAWVESKDKQPLASARQWLKRADIELGLVEFKAPTDFRIDFYCGDLNDASQIRNHSLGSLRRHHPEFIRANYLWFDRQWHHLKYVKPLVQVTLHRDINSTSMATEFTERSAGRTNVWKSSLGRANYYQQLGEYLFNELWLTDQKWQDPRPWLEFLEYWKVDLTKGFLRLAYQKILNQFLQDISPPDKNIDLQGRFLKAARQGWWSVHVQVLMQLAAGVAYFSNHKQLFLPLYKYLQQQLDLNNNQCYASLDLAWFDNFLPIVKPDLTTSKAQTIRGNFIDSAKRYFPDLVPKEINLITSHQLQAKATSFSGRPLTLAQYLVSLHNNK